MIKMDTIGAACQRAFRILGAYVVTNRTYEEKTYFSAYCALLVPAVSVGMLLGRSASLAAGNPLQSVRSHTGVRNEPLLAFNATDHNALNEIALGYEKDNNTGQQ